MTTILLALATLAAALVDGSILELQRGGDAWRILTCHFTHFTYEQLAWDALAFTFLGVACERRNRGAYHATLLASIVLIPLAVLAFDPRIDTYRGLSGIDSALFAMLVVSRRNVFLGVLFAGKIAFEFFTGGGVFVDDIVVVPVAHVAGAVAGAAFGVRQRKLPLSSPRRQPRQLALPR
jgi:rhomboid family GlyGly-CTERM serine protease